MPGPWVHLAENPDFFQGFSPEKGSYYESNVYDSQHKDQGRALWRILDSEPRRKDGLWTSAKLVAVTDSHLTWWLNTGPGAAYKRKFFLHFCICLEKDCRKTKRQGESEFHTDYFRTLSTEEVLEKKIPWFKDNDSKADIAQEVAKLTGGSKGGKKVAAKAKSSAAAAEVDWGLSEPEEDNDDEVSGDSPENVKAKLRQLKAETAKESDPPGRDRGREQEKEKKKKRAKKPKRSRSRSRRGRKQRQLESESSHGIYARPRWFGKAREETTSSSSSSPTEQPGTTAKGSRPDPEDKNKSGSRAMKSKKKKKKKAKRVDRGPYGAGPVQRYDGRSSDSESEDYTDGQGTGEEQVFRAGASGKSHQLQLQEYAEKHPGRLTSRLLKKMKTFLAREEAPLNVLKGQNLTPPVATAYYLTVIANQYREKLTLRTSRELRSLSKALDLIVQDHPERAGDVISQRIKAIEVSLADSSWLRAQHLELIPPEGASLLDKDEMVMANKEQLLDHRLKAALGPPTWRPPAKGEIGDKGKGKGKGKNKKGRGPEQQSWTPAPDGTKPPPA